MEKKYRVLVVLVVILSVLVFALGGYVVYDKVLKDNKPSVDNNFDNIKNEENKYEFLLKEYEDYTFVDHTKQETFKLGHTVSYDDTEYEELMNSYNGSENSTLYIAKDNTQKKAYFLMDENKYYIGVEDVEKIYVYTGKNYGYGCSNGFFLVYLLDSKGVAYLYDGHLKDVVYPADIVDDFEKISSNVKFEKLGRVKFDMFSGCGWPSYQIGIDSKGNEYNLASGEKFDVDYAYYLGFNSTVAIKTNGDMYEKDIDDDDYTKTDVKVRKLISYAGNDFIFVDDNGYLGVVEYDGAMFVGYKKISDKKVNSVFVKEEENKTYLHVVYEDSTIQDFEY